MVGGHERAQDYIEKQLLRFPVPFISGKEEERKEGRKRKLNNKKNVHSS